MRFRETTLAVAIGGAAVLAGVMLAVPEWNAVPCAVGFRGQHVDPDGSLVAGTCDAWGCFDGRRKVLEGPHRLAHGPSRRYDLTAPCLARGTAW
jgi:hypothetical protein